MADGAWSSVVSALTPRGGGSTATVTVSAVSGAVGSWSEIVSATTPSSPEGGSTAIVKVVALAVQGYDDVYSDVYALETPTVKSGGRTTVPLVRAFGGGVRSGGGGGPVIPPVIPQLPEAVIYNLSVVARTPQPVGAPTLTEIGVLQGWSGLTWEEAMSAEAPATVTVDPHGQAESVRERLADLVDATEVWIYRDGAMVFAGPVVGLQPQASGGGLVTNINLRSLWHYPRRWWVELFSTLTYTNLDQYEIVRRLVNYYQALEYGHFGLSVSAGSSGQLRDRTYNGAENHNIGVRIEELAGVSGGFDFTINPQLRRIQLGVAGTESDVVLDRRNVIDPQAFMSVGPDDLISEAYAKGDTIGAHLFNAAVRARWGRTGSFQSFDGVTAQVTLDSHAQGMLSERGEMHYETGPDLIPVPGASVEDIILGDRIEIAYDYGFAALSTRRQVGRKRVAVGQTGDETISVAFTGQKRLTERIKDLERRVEELGARG